MHWPPFDREELKRAQAGDPEALGRFFDHHFGRIFSVVQRFVGRRDVAQDITQDIFLKLRRHIGRLDIEHDPAPWLFTVAVNACRDHRRSAWWRVSRRMVPLDRDPEATALSSNAPDPEQAFVTAEEERRLQAAILRLPPELRLSVILHDFDGLPHEQIAEVTGTTHAAARKRHSRALRALAHMLQEGATS
jgi:RNA polymerase sigma-70 factor (ECF subfamily)